MNGLYSLILVIWITLLVISGFLVIFIAPIEIIIFSDRLDLLITSIIQALIAIIIVLMLIAFLSYLKKIYLQKKLKI